MPNEKEEATELVKKRAAVKGSITKLVKFFGVDCNIQDLTREAVLVKKERLQTLFERYEQLNMDDDDADAVEDKVIKTLTVIQETLSKFDSKKHLVMDPKPAPPPTKLPQIDVPTFTGIYSDFKPFMELFDSLIDRNSSLEPIQKFYYFRSFLKGEPYDLVKNLPMVADSYSKARKIINDRFNNVYQLTNALLCNILDLAPLTQPSARNIRQFVSILKQELAALSNLGHAVDQWDPILMCILTRKVDNLSKRDYEHDRDRSQDPTVKNFIDFLEQRAVELECSEPQAPPAGRALQPPASRAASAPQPKKSSVATVAAATVESGSPCLYCKSHDNKHKLFNCAAFKLLHSAERLKFAADNKICKVCLNKHGKKCRFFFKCAKCKEKHNTIMHDDSIQSPVTLLSETCPTMVLLPTAKVKIISSNGTEVHVKALLDSGAQVSLVTRELVDLLKVKTKSINTSVLGVGNTTSNLNQCARLELHSLVREFKIPVTCHVLDKITSRLPQKRIPKSEFVLPEGLTLADKDFNEPSTIHILLGADILFQVLLPPEPVTSLAGPVSSRQDGTAQTTASFVNTQFGHIVAGSLPNHHTQQVVNLFCKSCDSDLSQSIEQFWKQESVPEIFPEKVSEHETCEQIFQSTVKLNDNKFEVDLPLKLPLDSINESLGDSLYLALKRFHNLESRLQKDENLFKMYKDFIDEYIALGHGSVVDINQYDLSKDAVYFLPHHPVVRMDKKTTKCRVVFDGSMRTSKKVSLNNILLNGPVVQNELFDILLLFRVGQYFYLTDIRQMFRAVSLNPKYRPLLNILWRDDPSEDIQCIQLNTVTYGLKSSSYLATRCLIELAERFRGEFPQAADILEQNTYVDDVCVSNDCLQTLMESKDQLRDLLSMGGFKLHKWSSNEAEILQDIPEELRQFDEIDLQKDNFCMKTLGINFNVKTDSFILSSPVSEEKVPETKREILSFISKFYDPLSLAGPVTVSAKAIMQKLWQAEIDWDSSPAQELRDAWLEFYYSLANMRPIHIDRYVCVQHAEYIQLIGFADASSTTAYGCCIYLRVVDKTGNVKVSLLCSKSRINPLKNKLSVPRLELNAAVLLAKLVSRVRNTLAPRLNISDVILHSDSQIVLAWIETNINKLNTYVANRVREIVKLTGQYRWVYVPSDQNPADTLSRGALPQDMEHHPLWWRGPQYLHDREYKPVSHTPPAMLEELPETKQLSAFPSAMVNTVNSELPLSLEFLDKYSDINKMQRVLAYVLRFCKNLKGTINVNSYLLSEELNESLLLIVKYEQQQYFAPEIDLLKQKKPIKGSLNSVNPFIDDRGLLRVGGRIDCATIPFSQRHPVILPNKSRVTEMIISSEHIKNLHAGQKLTLSSINQRFWIINGIKEIKKIIHKCLTCYRLKAKVAEQLMGSLPQDRVNVSRPFQKVGMDFAGPISVKQSRVRRALVTKGYICVFVCFVTKAVHLELTSSLTTAAFLASLKRFIARRGLPSDIHCDNASTFKGARTQLDELFRLQSSGDHRRQVQSFAAQQGINFHFIPSYSPVFGGLWEAAVKSTKYHLKRVMQKALLTYEELGTVLAQIESVLNSRPLTPMSTDINDYTYLTPGHFLIGTALNAYPERNVVDVPINRLSFWNVCSNMFQHFWKVWSKQYLNVLQCRPKWKNNFPNVKVGSLVILVDNDLPPLHWRMARVINVFPGADNKVRAVEVRTSNGNSHRRSITKICLLPIDV